MFYYIIVIAETDHLWIYLCNYYRNRHTDLQEVHFESIPPPSPPYPTDNLEKIEDAKKTTENNSEW